MASHEAGSKGFIPAAGAASLHGEPLDDDATLPLDAFLRKMEAVFASFEEDNVASPLRVCDAHIT